MLLLLVAGENLHGNVLTDDDQCEDVDGGCALTALQKRSLATDEQGGCPAGLGRAVGGAPCRPCPEGTYSEEGRQLTGRLIIVFSRMRSEGFSFNSAL
eukprot:g4124.t1